jgi:hypothetical protein
MPTTQVLLAQSTLEALEDKDDVVMGSDDDVEEPMGKNKENRKRERDVDIPGYHEPDRAAQSDADTEDYEEDFDEIKKVEVSDQEQRSAGRLESWLEHEVRIVVVLGGA